MCLKNIKNEERILGARKPHIRHVAPAAPETVRYTAYLPRSVYRQLKELAFTHDRKMHEFVLEGLDLVFRAPCCGQ